MDAIILAGGETPEKLRAALAGSTPDAISTERALLSINGRAAIEYVLQSLQEISTIEKIIVVGLPQTLKEIEKSAPDALRVGARSTLAANVMAGMNAASSSQLLLCTCDIPFVSAQTWREFLEKAASKNLQAAYPIVARAQVEKQFPEGKRTFATLTNGTFTGGNAFVLPRENREQLENLISVAYRARKNPLALAKILGLGFVVKAVRKKLSIADLEKKMSQVLNCRAGAIEMEDAAIAFDIDKKDDYDLAQKLLKNSKEEK